MSICLHQINGSQHYVAFHIANTKINNLATAWTCSCCQDASFKIVYLVHLICPLSCKNYIGLQQTVMLMTRCLQTARLDWTVTATSADSCIVVVLHDSHVCVPFSIYQLALSLVYISSSTPLSPSVDKVFVWLDLHHAWLDTPSAFELVSSYFFPVVMLCLWESWVPI